MQGSMRSYVASLAAKAGITSGPGSPPDTAIAAPSEARRTFAALFFNTDALTLAQTLFCLDRELLQCHSVASQVGSLLWLEETLVREVEAVAGYDPTDLNRAEVYFWYLKVYGSLLDRLLVSFRDEPRVMDFATTNLKESVSKMEMTHAKVHSGMVFATDWIEVAAAKLKAHARGGAGLPPKFLRLLTVLNTPTHTLSELVHIFTQDKVDVNEDWYQGALFLKGMALRAEASRDDAVALQAFLHNTLHTRENGNLYSWKWLFAVSDCLVGLAVGGAEKWVCKRAIQAPPGYLDLMNVLHLDPFTRPHRNMHLREGVSLGVRRIVAWGAAVMAHPQPRVRGSRSSTGGEDSPKSALGSPTIASKSRPGLSPLKIVRSPTTTKDSAESPRDSPSATAQARRQSGSGAEKGGSTTASRKGSEAPAAPVMGAPPSPTTLARQSSEEALSRLMREHAAMRADHAAKEQSLVKALGALQRSYDQLKTKYTRSEARVAELTRENRALISQLEKMREGNPTDGATPPPTRSAYPPLDDDSHASVPSRDSQSSDSDPCRALPHVVSDLSLPLRRNPQSAASTPTKTAAPVPAPDKKSGLGSPRSPNSVTGSSTSDGSDRSTSGARGSAGTTPGRVVQSASASTLTSLSPRGGVPPSPHSHTVPGSRGKAALRDTPAAAAKSPEKRKGDTPTAPINTGSTARARNNSGGDYRWDKSEETSDCASADSTPCSPPSHYGLERWPEAMPASPVTPRDPGSPTGGVFPPGTPEARAAGVLPPKAYRRRHTPTAQHLSSESSDLSDLAASAIAMRTDAAAAGRRGSASGATSTLIDPVAPVEETPSEEPSGSKTSPTRGANNVRDSPVRATKEGSPQSGSPISSPRDAWQNDLRPKRIPHTPPPDSLIIAQRARIARAVLENQRADGGARLQEHRRSSSSSSDSVASPMSSATPTSPIVNAPGSPAVTPLAAATDSVAMGRNPAEEGGQEGLLAPVGTPPPVPPSPVGVKKAPALDGSMRRLIAGDLAPPHASATGEAAAVDEDETSEDSDGSDGNDGVNNRAAKLQAMLQDSMMQWEKAGTPQPPTAAPPVKPKEKKRVRWNEQIASVLIFERDPTEDEPSPFNPSPEKIARLLNRAPPGPFQHYMMGPVPPGTIPGMPPMPPFPGPYGAPPFAPQTPMAPPPYGAPPGSSPYGTPTKAPGPFGAAPGFAGAAGGQFGAGVPPPFGAPRPGFPPSRPQ